MRIAIVSAAAGSGTTVVTTGLGLAVSGPVQVLDCNVEAPACRTFFGGDGARTEPVHVNIPVVNDHLCIGCNECGELCAYEAIVSFGASPFVSADACRACGGCMLVCPTGAISEKAVAVGDITESRAGDVRLVQGRVHVGSPQSDAVVREVIRRTDTSSTVIVDCPAGPTQTAALSMDGADFVVIVATDTPNAVHGVKSMEALISSMSLPYGIVVNRKTDGRSPVHEYCREQAIDILGEIPESRDIAEAVAAGTSPSAKIVPLANTMQELKERIVSNGMRHK